MLPLGASNWQLISPLLGQGQIKSSLDLVFPQFLKWKHSLVNICSLSALSSCSFQTLFKARAGRPRKVVKSQPPALHSASTCLRTIRSRRELPADQPRRSDPGQKEVDEELPTKASSGRLQFNLQTFHSRFLIRNILLVC